MRKPNHRELIKTWDNKTLRETLAAVKQHIADLKRDREDATKWETRAADLADELATR